MGIFTVCSILCLILLLTLIIAWKRSQPLHHIPSFVSSIQKNHSSPFITHISLSISQCADDYIPLFSQLKTSPVVSQCKCNDTYHISNGTCASDCQMIPVSPPLSLFKIQGYLLCAKPYKYNDFVKSTDGQCPPNYTLCGRDSRVFLCFPNTRECPLNHLFFSEHVLNLDYSYSTILMSNSFRLYFSNSQKDFPLLTTDFQLGFQQEVCIDTTQIILPAYHYKFWTYELNYPEDGCDTSISSHLSYVDTRYIKISSQPFKNLLYSNGLREYSQTYNLGIYNFFESKTDTFDIDIMFRPRIYYNPECIIDDKTPANSLFTLSEHSNADRIFSLIVASFIMGLITSLLGCSGIILKNFCSRKRTRRKLMMFILSGLVILFTLTLVPVILLHIRVKEANHSFYNSKLDEGVVCGDRYVHAIIKEIVYSYKKTKSIAIALIFFIILACCSWIAFVFIKMISNETEYETRTQSSRNNSMKKVHLFKTVTENERYTNVQIDSTKEQEIRVEDQDNVETWHDNRIASYIPKNNFIDEDAMYSYDSEMVYKPHVNNRALGISKTILKNSGKHNPEDDYFKRKNRRRNKNMKLKKRLKKQKGFELINTHNLNDITRNYDSDSYESSSEEEPSQIIPHKYNTITIMSPNLSMNESQIINKRMNIKKDQKFNYSKESEVRLQKSEIPSNNEQIFMNEKLEKEQSIVKSPKKNNKQKLLESMGLLTNNENTPKRTVAKRKPVTDKPRKSRNKTTSQASSKDQSIIASKVKKQSKHQLDVTDEPIEVKLETRRSRKGNNITLIHLLGNSRILL